MKSKIKLICVLLLTSCATAPRSLKSQDFSHLFEHRSGLIVPAEVQGASHPNTQCKMEFSDTSGRKQALTFEQGSDLYFIDLPPGIYQVTGLRCDRGVYAIENQPPWSRFVINDGTLSYFSLLKFNVAQEAMVQHPSRQESVEAFERTWKALSTSDRQRLVLGMDGRKLTDQMADIQKEVNFHFKAQNPPANAEELKEPVMDCYRKEVIQNHTLLGKMEYQLSYRKGKLDKMTPGSRNTNTYTPQFHECVEKAFSSFSPPTPVEVKITL